MKVRLTPRALSETKRKKRWWRENRPAAPDLFEEELSATIDLLRTTPLMGTVYPANLSAVVRRTLMPRTRNYLHYAVHENEVVVLSVWGTPRERGPKL